MNGRNIGTLALWAAIAVHLALAISMPLFGLRLFPGAPVPMLLVITAAHALRRYSLASFLVFAAIAFVVSNAYENLSILTGFPFGNYHYTDALGAKLFLVPWVICFAYFSAGYFAWSIAHILLGIFGARPRGVDVFFVPLIASFVMVMWDLVMDPINATIGGSWIWEDGGSYFGVPFSNYLGWLLCVYTIFQLFALYLTAQADRGELPDAQRARLPQAYWYQAIIPFFAISLSWTLRSLVGSDFVVTDPAGQSWRTMQIYESMTLVGIFTIWFVCLLSALLVNRFQPTRINSPSPRC